MFLPIINKGKQNFNKCEFQLVVTSIFYIFFFVINYINSKSDFFANNSGNSIVWLFCLYIIGAYIGKFYPEYTGIKGYIKLSK
jgi:hypothetical protein